jgi:hypothetical protein
MTRSPVATLPIFGAAPHAGSHATFPGDVVAEHATTPNTRLVAALSGTVAPFTDTICVRMTRTTVILGFAGREGKSFRVTTLIKSRFRTNQSLAAIGRRLAEEVRFLAATTAAAPSAARRNASALIIAAAGHDRKSQHDRQSFESLHVSPQTVLVTTFKTLGCLLTKNWIFVNPNCNLWALALLH